MMHNVSNRAESIPENMGFRIDSAFGDRESSSAMRSHRSCSAFPSFFFSVFLISVVEGSDFVHAPTDSLTD